MIVSTETELSAVLSDFAERLVSVLDRHLDEKLDPLKRKPLPSGEYLSVEDVATYLGVSPSVVRYRCRRGDLPAIKLGNRGDRSDWRILRSGVPGLSPVETAPTDYTSDDSLEHQG